jgi:lysosomal acid lipase/cholesteryl ester hydrolase
MAINFLNLGYDVWLGNTRGNIYSRGNVNNDILEQKFFEFSFYEIGT